MEFVEESLMQNTIGILNREVPLESLPIGFQRLYYFHYLENILKNSISKK